MKFQLSLHIFHVEVKNFSLTKTRNVNIISLIVFILIERLSILKNSLVEKIDANTYRIQDSRIPKVLNGWNLGGRQHGNFYEWFKITKVNSTSPLSEIIVNLDRDNNHYRNGQDIMHLATRSVSYLPLLTVLLENGYKANQRDCNGNTPYWNTVLSHDNTIVEKERFVQLLNKFGGDINLRNLSGETLISNCIHKGSYNDAIMIARNGANPFLYDNYGGNPKKAVDTVSPSLAESLRNAYLKFHKENFSEKLHTISQDTLLSRLSTSSRKSQDNLQMNLQNHLL